MIQQQTYLASAAFCPFSSICVSSRMNLIRPLRGPWARASLETVAPITCHVSASRQVYVRHFEITHLVQQLELGTV
jgi:hypothetical protein